MGSVGSGHVTVPHSTPPFDPAIRHLRLVWSAGRMTDELRELRGAAGNGQDNACGRHLAHSSACPAPAPALRATPRPRSPIAANHWRRTRRKRRGSDAGPGTDTKIRGRADRRPVSALFLACQEIQVRRQGCQVRTSAPWAEHAGSYARRSQSSTASNIRAKRRLVGTPIGKRPGGWGRGRLKRAKCAGPQCLLPASNRHEHARNVLITMHDG